MSASATELALLHKGLAMETSTTAKVINWRRPEIPFQQAALPPLPPLHDHLLTSQCYTHKSWYAHPKERRRLEGIDVVNPSPDGRDGFASLALLGESPVAYHVTGMLLKLFPSATRDYVETKKEALTCHRTLSSMYRHYGLQRHLKIGPTGPPPGSLERQNLYGEAFIAYIGACDGQSAQSKQHTADFLKRLYSAPVWTQLSPPSSKKEKKRLHQAKAEAAAKARLAEIAKHRPKQRAAGDVKKKEQKTPKKVEERKEEATKKGKKKKEEEEEEKVVTHPVPAAARVERPASAQVPALAVTPATKATQLDKASKEMPWQASKGPKTRDQAKKVKAQQAAKQKHEAKPKPEIKVKQEPSVKQEVKVKQEK